MSNGIIIIVVGVLMLIGLFLNVQFHKKIKADHPDLWRELGSPTIFRNSSRKTRSAIYRYIMGKKYRDTNDPELIRLCDGIRYLYYTLYILFGVLIIAIFLKR